VSYHSFSLLYQLLSWSWMGFWGHCQLERNFVLTVGTLLVCVYSNGYSEG
jgi:hypothetical protein